MKSEKERRDGGHGRVSLLLGLEIGGDSALLTLVTREGRIAGSLREPLRDPAREWWRGHPEQHVRAALRLVERAGDEGLFLGAEVAGIGLAAEPGLVFLDHEYGVVPPESLPFGAGAGVGGEAGASPREALRRLPSEAPELTRRAAVVLSTLDFLRFRMTGALGTHAAFAWATGFVSAENPTAWRKGLIVECGLPEAMFPPIFSAECRVSVVSEDFLSRSGIPRGVWVNAGSDPISAQLLVAAEPRAERRSLLVAPERTTCWRTVGIDRVTDAALPLASGCPWFAPVEGGLEEWSEAIRSEPERWVLDTRAEEIPERWRERGWEPVLVAADAGGPSAGAAIQAGLGLGWWRDLRVLWRKRRPPIPMEEWLARRADATGVAGLSADGA